MANVVQIGFVRLVSSFQTLSVANPAHHDMRRLDLSVQWWEAPYQSFRSGLLRCCFVLDRARLSETLRALAAREGRVLRRGAGPGRDASSIIACNRAIATLRLATCERDAYSMILISIPNRSTILSRVVSLKAREAAMSNRSSALDDVLFACCPPGPPGVSNRHRNSLSGISNLVMDPLHSFRNILQWGVDA